MVKFTLPAGHIPVTKVPQSGFLLFLDENVNLNAFPSGICPVLKQDESFYWIDQKGTVVKDFGNTYAKMAPFAEGYCMAWEKMETRDNGYMLLFLNSSGNNAFGNKKYWEADPFSEGYAAVQLQDENGPWGYIDKTGEIVVTPDKTIKGSVSKLGAFHEGMAIATSREKLPDGEYSYIHRYYFINNTGKISLDLEKLFAPASVTNVTNFSDGIASVSIQHADETREFKLIDKSGKVIDTYKNVGQFTGFVKGLASLYFEIPAEDDGFHLDRKLIDKNGKIIIPVLDTAKTSLFQVDEINEQFYHAKGIDRIKKDFCGLVFSRKNNRVIYQTDGQILSMLNDVILVKHKSSEEIELVRLPNQVLWKTPIENKLFTSMDEALRAKDKVHRLDLFSVDELPVRLYELTHLERLSLGYGKMESIPIGIGKLKDLKELQLSDLKELHSLPADLLQLTKLEKLTIRDCDGLQGVIENFIEKMPSLKSVWFENFEETPGFVDRMKVINPSLDIQSMSSGSIMEEGLILEEVSAPKEN